MDLEYVKKYLRDYDGPDLRLMEVCGTHTGEIARSGIPSLLSPAIHLIAGPGCPVCVTVAAVIDRLVELSKEPGTTVLSFGDLYRVPGSKGSLTSARAEGGSVNLLYAPMDAVDMASSHPDQNFILAAVGFETTAPVYADVLDEIQKRGIGNLKLITSIKTMPGVIRRVFRAADEGAGIDGFLAPGHVCVITGSRQYEELARELGVPFVVAPFDPEGLLLSVYTLVRSRGSGVCRNLYPAFVTKEGNTRAQEAVKRCFEPYDAAWRGLGVIEDSGLAIRGEFAAYDAGSRGLDEDHLPEGCRCGDVLTGHIPPADCPMFGSICTPDMPYGACMVSAEGSCRSEYEYMC